MIENNNKTEKDRRKGNKKKTIGIFMGLGWKQ